MSMLAQVLQITLLSHVKLSMQLAVWEGPSYLFWLVMITVRYKFLQSLTNALVCIPAQLLHLLLHELHVALCIPLHFIHLLLSICSSMMHNVAPY